MVERKSILAQSKEEYIGLMTLLHKQGYTWSNGEATHDFNECEYVEDDKLSIDCWENKTISYSHYEGQQCAEEGIVTAEQYLVDHFVLFTTNPIIESWP